MAQFKGKPVIENALDATEGIFKERTVVTRYADVAGLCKERRIETVVHDLKNKNDTVRLGIEKMPYVDGYMFCPADQPLLKCSTVMALVLSALNEPEFIWRLSCGEKAGAPVWFPKDLFPELLSLPEGKGGGALIRKYPERVGTVPAEDASELMDVDTPEDLEKAAELFQPLCS